MALFFRNSFEAFAKHPKVLHFCSTKGKSVPVVLHLPYPSIRVLNQTRLASTAYGGKQPVRSVRKHKLEVEKGEEA